MSDKVKAIRELRALYRVSQAVSATLDLGHIVENILGILAEELGMQRGTLALLDPETGELAIEAAHGLSRAEQRRGRYKVGEGVMGRVLQTGEPMIIPNLGQEPLFLDRTGARSGIDRSQVAFLCVPVKVESRTVGVLSADQVSEEYQELEEDLRFLTIVATVVAQAVRIRQMVSREKGRLEQENLALRRALEDSFELDNLVGRSREMRAVYDTVRLLARSRSPVLVTGEAGAGKGAVATAMHLLSSRRERPFVPVSCRGVSEALLEQQLFGGSYANWDPAAPGEELPGSLSLARGGTVFLADVDTLPPALQEKLLAVLRDGTFTPCGSANPVRADVRVIASTTRDLAADVAAGLFRKDLYHRLNACPVHVPALREHREDIPLLARHFLQQLCARDGRAVEGIEAEALALLARRAWPGNVAELRQAVEEALLTTGGRWLRSADFPSEAVPGLSPGPAAIETAVGRVVAELFRDRPAEGVYRAILDRVERTLVQQALRKCGGVRVQAARMLGINRNTLYAILERTDTP